LTARHKGREDEEEVPIRYSVALRKGEDTHRPLYSQEDPVPIIQSDTKKRELLKNPTKIEEIQEKKIIDRN